MQQVTTLHKSEEDPLNLSATPIDNDDAQKPRNHPLRFFDWDRESQLQAFFAWLPEELHDAPGIDWTKIPSRTMGYCIRTVGNSPDAPALAMAAAVAYGAMTNPSLQNLIVSLKHLFQGLRDVCGMEHIADLQHVHTWHNFLAHTQRTEGRKKQVKAYLAVARKHFQGYLQRLEPVDRQRMQAYTFPLLPHNFLQTHFPESSHRAAQQAKRKASSDVLVPLYPVLRQLVRFRKQLAERTFAAIREARHKVEVGEAELPFHFSHIDSIPFVNRDAQTISEVQVQGREVTMQFVLWDKQTWVLHHQDSYSHWIVEDAKMGRASYAPELNTYFVEYDGPPSDCLWFGDLVEHHLLQQFKKLDTFPEGYLERWQLARSLGFTNGCHCSRPGLLNLGDHWFAEPIHRGGMLFEPESMWRGILFGTALTMIALSNGSRVSELLQVSWNKERRVTRTETVVVLGDNGQPLLGDDRKPLTKQVKIYLQHLLPKGAKTEEERQLFPLSKECMRLLGEIKQLLEEAHGNIPVVRPSLTSVKYEHLTPEQYLFQWGASSDGKHGIISTPEVQVLIRLVLHGLDLYTAQGDPIRVSTHLLRHVMATHARQYRNVPPEAIAHFFLHHRIFALTGRTPSLSEVSNYYFHMTEEQRFAIIRADLDEQEELDQVLMQTAPTPRDLEQKNEVLRSIYERWQTLHPTAFGNCGCSGLCPRGTDRALCLGCPHHVEDAAKLNAALAWRDSYAKQAAILEAQGNSIDARQARIKVQYLDDMISVMYLQLQAEADGSYVPLPKLLRLSPRKKEEGHEEEN